MFLPHPTLPEVVGEYGRNLILRKTNWHYYFQAKRYVTNSIPIKKAEKALIRFVETSGRCRLAARLRIYGLFAGHCIYIFIYITIYNHILQYISIYDNIFDLEWVFEQCCYPMCCLTFSKPWLGGLKYV